MMLLRRVGKPELGFTLIELMIVVAIISILAAISFPAYDAYVIRGKRAEGRAMLMDAASKMEKHYGDCLKFGTNIAAAKDCAADNVNLCGAAACLSETDKYTLSLDNAGANSYTVEATPSFDDTECGTFKLKHTGEKCISSLDAPAGGGADTCSTANAASADFVANCWGR